MQNKKKTKKKTTNNTQNLKTIAKLPHTLEQHNKYNHELNSRWLFFYSTKIAAYDGTSVSRITIQRITQLWRSQTYQLWCFIYNFFCFLNLVVLKMIWETGVYVKEIIFFIYFCFPGFLVPRFTLRYFSVPQSAVFKQELGDRNLSLLKSAPFSRTKSLFLNVFVIYTSKLLSNSVKESTI